MGEWQFSAQGTREEVRVEISRVTRELWTGERSSIDAAAAHALVTIRELPPEIVRVVVRAHGNTHSERFRVSLEIVGMPPTPGAE